MLKASLPKTSQPRLSKEAGSKNFPSRLSVLQPNLSPDNCEDSAWPESRDLVAGLTTVISYLTLRDSLEKYLHSNPASVRVSLGPVDIFDKYKARWDCHNKWYKWWQILSSENFTSHSWLDFYWIIVCINWLMAKTLTNANLWSCRAINLWENLQL